MGLWTKSGVAKDTVAGNANFANTVLRPIFEDKELMPTNAGRIIFVDHSRTGQSINTLSLEIQDHDLVPFADPRLRYINLIYKTKHEPPLNVYGAPLLANIPVEDAQMERLDLATVGRVTPYYCSLYWEDKWEDIPYPDKPAARGILDQISVRAATWATNPPPIPLPPAPPLPGTPARGPIIPVTPGSEPPPLSPTLPFGSPSGQGSSTPNIFGPGLRQLSSPFARVLDQLGRQGLSGQGSSGQGSSGPSASAPGSQQRISPFERVVAEGREPRPTRRPAFPPEAESGFKPLRRLE